MNKMNRHGQRFEDFRQLYFDQIAQDKGTMFNFFLQNNDIFQAIAVEDEEHLTKQSLTYMNRMANVLVGTYAGVFFVDKVLLRNYPKQPNFRATIFLFKYLAVPLLNYGIFRNYFSKDIQNSFRRMADKYHFGYYEYNKQIKSIYRIFKRAMDILERAERVNKLEELMTKRNQFNWAGIPEFKSKYTIDTTAE